ncbi:class I SAM-dependent methyltransferase [Cohnella cholangitidis]|uniref:Class I SAM-dependent methyltransferase n=2 Tax=Cohnella cholangitidis TaxID=2598458 RepID=A0A7G5C6Z3_9BACL|nr:class I SAM-dependent methyltransferase [Cohnella cholangitidis]
MNETTSKKIIIFGTGSYADKLCDSFPELNVEYFVDNDSNKWGSEFNGKKIESPETLLKENPDHLAVLIASSYANQISSQLNNLGFQEGRQYFFIKDLSFLAGYFRLYEDGHYYSPYPSNQEIRARESELFDRTRSELPGIDLNVADQLSFLRAISVYIREFPYVGGNGNNGLRYVGDNLYFGLADAFCLYGIIRHVKPRRIIEVGSGYSSAVMLDTNSMFCNGNVNCTFIEPYPDRLLSLLSSEEERQRIVAEKLQDVDIALFDELEAGDILFIDSSHVSKIGSDVNRLIFDILPRLKAGVFIHFHDIFYPFELPATWIYEGRAWNESYILRAFLQFNESYKIKLWNHYLSLHHAKFYSELIPPGSLLGGGSIWIEKC